MANLEEVRKIEESIIEIQGKENTHVYCHLNIQEDKNSKELNKIVIKKLYFVIIICTIFVCVELIGGIIAQSLAIISDSLHLMTDILGFIVSIYSIIYSQNKPTNKYNFGYHRFELLGAYISINFVILINISLSVNPSLF